MVRRSRLEIYMDILHEIKQGTRKPTRIMYSTNLSWMLLSKILVSLRDQNLIEEKKVMRSKRYEITKKGMKVLNYFIKVKEVLLPLPVV